MRRITAKGFCKSNQGQALVEYLLMIIVAVALIGGAVYQFNDAFRKYLQSYFGEYLACLLETGELPRLGYEESESICDDSFEPFDLAQGRPLKGGAAGAGDGKGEGREQPNNAAVGGESGSTGGSARGGANFQRASDYERNQMDAEEEQRKGASGKGLGFMDVGGARGSTSLSWGRNYSMVDEKLSTAYLKQKKPKESKKEQSADLESETRARKVVKVPLGKEKKEEVVEEDPFDLGNLFRYLIIAAIVLAIIIFLGGQALQISKSWE